MEFAIQSVHSRAHPTVSKYSAAFDLIPSPKTFPLPPHNDPYNVEKAFGGSSFTPALDEDSLNLVADFDEKEG